MADDDDAQSGEEQSGPITTDAKFIGEHLSTVARTGDGLSYAYIKCDLSGQNIDTLEEIDQFPHLRDVNLSKNQLSEVTKLGNCTELLAVNLAGNDFSNAFPDMGGAALEHLQWVDLSSNKLTSIGDVPHRNLTVFNAKDNQIEAISGLESLSKLSKLELRANKLTSTAGIGAAASLKALYLAKNEIADIAEIDSLSQLETLHLRDNQITSLAGFSSNNACLSYLNLRGNKDLAEPEELKALSVLPKLTTLNLMECEVVNAMGEDYRVDVLVMLPYLRKLDKVDVTPEEQEAAQEKAKAAAEAAAAAAAEAAAGGES